MVNESRQQQLQNSPETYHSLENRLLPAANCVNKVADTFYYYYKVVTVYCCVFATLLHSAQGRQPFSNLTKSCA